MSLESQTAGDLTVGEGYLWATLVDTDQLARVGVDGGRPASFPTGRGPAGLVVHDGVVWVVNRTASTITRIGVASGRPRRDEIQMPLNPYEIAAYRGSIWVTSLTEGKIARITGRGG